MSLQTSGNKAQVILHSSARSKPANRNSSRRHFSLISNVARIVQIKLRRIVLTCRLIRTGHAIQ